MIKLKKDALQQIELAFCHRFEQVMSAYNKADNLLVVELMQRGLLSYEDLVEPSKLSLEDEFWSCISVTEKEQHTQDIGRILKFMQAGKMAAAMDEIAALKDRYISDTTTRQLYSLIEDYMNNKEEYKEEYDA